MPSTRIRPSDPGLMFKWSAPKATSASRTSASGSLVSSLMSSSSHGASLAALSKTS